MRFKIGFFFLFLSGCNVFTAWDPPQTDDEILEQARIDFDKLNYEKAFSSYASLNSAEKKEIASVERIILSLDQIGLDLSFFAQIFDGKKINPGALITKMANQIGLKASEEKRLALFSSLKVVQGFSNPSLKALGEMLCSLALLAEIFAESSTNGVFLMSNLVSYPDLCQQSTRNLANVNESDLSAYCSSAGALQVGTPIYDLRYATTSMLSGPPTLYMVNSCFALFVKAIRVLVSSSNLKFVFLLLYDLLLLYPLDSAYGEYFYRSILINNDIGVST